MSEFLELLETVRAEDASHQRLFGDAGQSVRQMRRDTPQYQRALSEAASLFESVCSGRTPMYRLQEAMSTSDFPLMFADTIDRQMLGIYAEWPTAWSQIARRGTVPDFRSVKRFAVDGTEAPLDVVPAGSEYPEAGKTETQYEYSVQKRGRRVPFLWEALVNDDLDALRRTPERLAKAARMSEERFVTELYCDNSTFFHAGNNNNVVDGNPSLDLDALEEGLTTLWSQQDADGNPIFTGQVRLVVPPQLTLTAEKLVFSGLRFTSGSNELIGGNVVAQRVAEVVTNPWLPIVDPTNGDTGWYLFADPGVGRPALEVGFLRGNEAPALYLKSPNAVRVGGGTVGAEEGDFETDGVNYKVRHVFGGTMMEPKAAVYSNGTG
jgi:hypothetical protein